MKNAKLSRVFKMALGLILAISLIIVPVGCGNKKVEDPNPVDNGQGTNPDQGTTPVAEGKYTLYDSLAGSPDTWNPHEWETATDRYIMDYTTLGLYEFVLAESKDKYEIIPEMAEEMPIDVTSNYVGNETFGVPADATEGWAYTVKLNENACWQNGVKINADTYIYSLQQILNWQMKNYRASDQYEGSVVIANAEAYYKQQAPIYTDIYTGEKDADGNPIYRDVEDKDMKFSLINPVAFFGDSAKSYYSSYADYFLDADGNDIFEKYSKEDYYDLTEEAKADILTVCEAFGDTNPEAYKEFCFTYDGISEPVDWSSVGILKTGEYEITYVLGKPATSFYFKYGTSSIPLVYEELYEANKKQTGDIIKTSYGTSVDTYMSYGPYILTEYQADKQITLAKNENWWGYTDGKHVGQYQTTDISCQIVKQQATELQLFLQGKLDNVSLVAADMETYRTSDYIMYTPQTYTTKISMNSSLNALKARETEGINKRILSYKDFRHAISLSFDREQFAAQCTATHSAGFGIINSMYIYDPENGLSYRSSKQAQETLCTLYGTSSVDDITGYDKVEAAKLFTQAYEQCLADGNISETDKIELEFLTYNSDEAYVKMITFFQEGINAATVGTPLEGRITIKMTPDEAYYDHAQAGQFEMIFSTWGGNSLDPFNMLSCYCDKSKMFEYGFEPDKETLTINVNGTDVTKTFYDWYLSLDSGEYLSADIDTKLNILAKVELGLLETYNCPPIYYRTVTSLHSQKINYATDEYVELVEFGGVRFMTYNYTDEEWEEYCKSQNYQLTY